jgi:hypothetical protein
VVSPVLSTYARSGDAIAWAGVLLLALVGGAVAVLSHVIALALLALCALAGWVVLCRRRPVAALGVVAGVACFSSHAYALLYAQGVLTVEQVRPLLALKDVLAAVLVAILIYRHRGDMRARKVVYAATPVVLLCAASVVLNSGHVPIEARLLGFRGMMVPVLGLLAGVLVALDMGTRAPRLILLVISAGATYAILEWLLPVALLTSIIQVGPYWANVKGQAAFLVGALPGNFFLGSGVRRLSGAFGDPLSAGYVLAASLALVLRAGSRRKVLVVPLAAALVLTFTRGGWIIATCVLAAAYMPSVLRGRHAAGAAGFGLLVISALTAVEPLRSFLQQTLAGTDGSSLAHRDALSRNLANDYTLLGGGVGSTGGAVAGQGILEGAEVTESAYTTLAGQVGWLGLAAFAVLLSGVLLFIADVGLRRVEARMAIAVMVGLLLTGIFSEQLLAFNSGFLPWALVGLTVAGVPVRVREPAVRDGDQEPRSVTV